MIIAIDEKDLQAIALNVQARLLESRADDTCSVPSAGAIAKAMSQLISQRIEILTTDPDEWTHDWADRHLLTQVAMAKEPQPVQLPSFV
jgi:hypothetical protein